MLEVIDIAKSYEEQPLLRGISFSVAAGETICLLGPSGSGKSTLLMIIAGLEIPEKGMVRWEGVNLASIPTHQRNFGFVFQDYALFPHLNVAENVAFGLKLRNMPRAAIDQRLTEILEMVNLIGFEHRHVTDLSGGEQQRVALARALAPNPRLLLFDEPLGALDRSLREQLLNELRSILHASGVPAIYVTHDQHEAFTLADRVLLLHDGSIVRSGHPQQVWSDPGSVWAARFLDAGNVVSGKIISNSKPFLVETPAGVFELECGVVPALARDGVGVAPVPGQSGHVHSIGDMVDLLINRRGVRQTDEGRISGVVVDVIFQQEGYKVTLNNGLDFLLPDPPRLGEKLFLSIPMTGIKCLRQDQ
jgi:ABC-type Fe3+/spermidine/putrescine transport system ATPase subunit